MPDFVLWYGGRRRFPNPLKGEPDNFELMTARTRQAALVAARRWQIAYLRRGFRCPLPSVGDVITLDWGLPPSPEVGIFWQVRDGTCPELITDSVPVDEAEPYGDFQTHGAHVEFWEKLAAMSPGALREKCLPDVARVTDYDDWPRGRVVFNRETGRFTLYADPKLQAASTIERITAHFHLPTDRVDVRSDAHYTT